MARTYKDSPRLRGKKNRSERGDNRGRRWGNEESAQRALLGRQPKFDQRRHDSRDSSEDLD